MTTRQTPPGQKSADLTNEQIQNLSPAARDAYFDQKARDGVDPNAPWFGMFKQWFEQAKGRQQSHQVGDQNVKDSTQGRDVQYVSGLSPSDADYMGNQHTQLKEFLDNNLNVQQVSDVSTAYFNVHKAFEGFGTAMSEAVSKSKGTWEGGAAEGAQSYFTSLGKWSDANSQNARLASETVYDQGTAAQTAKNAMPEPIPFSWGDEFKSWATSNPFNLADNVDKSIQKQKDSQEAHTQAAGVMSTYDKSLYEAASKQPEFAPPPSFTNPGGSGDPNGGGDKNGSNNPSGVNVPGHGSVNSPGGSGNFATGNVPGSTGTPHFSGPGSTTGAGLLPAGTTTPSGFTPGSIPSGSTSNPNQSFGGMPPMSPMPMGGGMNFGGDEAYNSKVGGGGGGRGAGGFGPGGSGGAGNATGAGSASGAARPGGIGAAEAAAGRGMGGLGSGSAAGRGGMGAGGMGRGQKGEGDEDTEHSRPTYLVEGDPDEVFGTDLRTAPPVIGE
ncbi:hypothetical protein [Amycolatopsis sp. NPDC004378]